MDAFHLVLIRQKSPPGIAKYRDMSSWELNSVRMVGHSENGRDGTRAHAIPVAEIPFAPAKHQSLCQKVATSLLSGAQFSARDR